MRILLIEDDSDIREILSANLRADNFAVDTASDGARGLYLAKINEYDFIILDNMLPHKNGIEVCREVRGLGKNIPILFLSVKSDASEKIAHLDAGADDYMSKPFSYDELLARIQALMRRSSFLQSNKLSVKNLTLDPSKYEVRMGDKEIYLTSKEFSLLELLLRNKGRTVSRGSILEHVWDMRGDPFSKTIETHVVNLRRKVELEGEKFIFTIRGRGYKIAES